MSVRFSSRVVFACLVASWSLAQQLSDFAGTWVFSAEGNAIFKLTLTAENGRIAGSLVKPKDLTISSDGDVTGVGPEQVTQRVEQATLNGDRLVLRIAGDQFEMVRQANNRATLRIEGMQPWALDRVVDGESVRLATHLPEREYSEEIRRVRKQVRELVKADQSARMAFDEASMKAADARSRPEVLRIFDRYGWVTYSLAGKDAAHDFWLLVQHQTPDMQRAMLPALERAAKAEDASMADYAYLYDRVQVGLGKPQHWGSQTKCENGKPVLAPVDDPQHLDERRKELFLPPVAEYLKADYLVEFCARAGK